VFLRGVLRCKLPRNSAARRSQPDAQVTWIRPPVRQPRQGPPRARRVASRSIRPVLGSRPAGSSGRRVSCSRGPTTTAIMSSDYWRRSNC
jgi:hypothetical protein